MDVTPGYTPEELAVKLPPPPAPDVLQATDASLHIVPSQTELWHVYKRGGDHPARWNALRFVGPLGSRFDHHLLPRRRQKRGILYLACDILTCVAETYQQTRHIDRHRDAPWLVACETTRPLQLLDITGLWPTRAGASMAINTGPRAITRAWSVAIYEAYPNIDGLWYCSSMAGNRTCVALYERGRDAIPPRPTLNRALADPTIFDVLCAAGEALGYTLS